jgi:hypothetical protein
LPKGNHPEYILARAWPPKLTRSGCSPPTSPCPGRTTPPSRRSRAPTAPEGLGLLAQPGHPGPVLPRALLPGWPAPATTACAPSTPFTAPCQADPGCPGPRSGDIHDR